MISTSIDDNSGGRNNRLPSAIAVAGGDGVQGDALFHTHYGVSQGPDSDILGTRRPILICGKEQGDGQDEGQDGQE